MKKLNLWVLFSFIGVVALAQHNYDDQSVIYSINDKVGIGTSSPREQLSIKPGSYTHSSSSAAFPFTISRVGSDVQNLFLGVDSNFNSIIASNNSGLVFGKYYGSTDSLYRYMYISNAGNVGIGTDSPASKLAVNGEIRATSIKVVASMAVPDYVFESDYELRSLEDTKQYIAENKHLPEIPSAKEIEADGIDLGEMNLRLLKKIEELTLYQINLLEQLKSQNTQIQVLQKEVSLLEKTLFE